MIHDLFHELGHAAVALTSCGSRTTSISLGEYQYCQHVPGVAVTFCVYPGWFYHSLYRNSMTSYWSEGNGYDYDICNEKLSAPMGGTFGLIFCWLSLFITVSLVWRLALKQEWSEATRAGALYIFQPLSLWTRAFRKGKFDWPLWFKMLLGFGAIVIQFDLINEVFYTYFPSRLIIWDYMKWGDGTTFWRAFGVSEETMLNVSYGVWAVLLVLYLTVFHIYLRYYKVLKSLKGTITPSQMEMISSKQ